MASTRRSAKHTVSQRLRSEPHRFSFVQAVRLLEQIGRASVPPRQAIGESSLPSQECVHLAASPTLSFPATEIAALRQHDPQMTDPPQPAKLVVGFMGLFGPSGVLPQHDTQRIINAGPRKNPERDFLDIFNHRVLSYFYRASIKYRLPFAYEQAYRQSNPQQQLTSRVLYSLAGMGTSGLKRRLIPQDEFAIEYAGLLRQQPKNGVSLRRMLSAYFGLPFKLYQFIGQWLVLSESNRSSMPSPQLPLGQNCQLGQSFIIGDRVWDISGKFRLCVGPLNRSQFEAFLPGSRNLAELAQIVRWYAGNQFDFDIQLELLAESVPEIQLHDTSGTQLGFNSWLISAAPTDNKRDAILVHSGLPTDAPQSTAG